MSERNKNEKNSPIRKKWEQFKVRMKEDPTSRAVCITAVVLVLAVSVLITATAIANRAKKPNPSAPAGTTARIPAATAPVTDPPATRPAETEPVNALPTAFLLPAEGVLGKGHDASAQVFSDTMQDYRVHLGIDITTVESAPVYAAAAGKIEKIWEDVRYGQCIAITHSGGAMTVYKNLSEELAEGITEGASVAAGALIGAVGNTAMIEIAEDPHLHFEMTVDGIAVDPLDYFDESALASLSVDETFEG